MIVFCLQEKKRRLKENIDKKGIDNDFAKIRSSLLTGHLSSPAQFELGQSLKCSMLPTSALTICHRI